MPMSHSLWSHTNTIISDNAYKHLTFEHWEEHLQQQDSQQAATNRKAWDWQKKMCKLVITDSEMRVTDEERI
jgi:hypothetical protein